MAGVIVFGTIAGFVLFSASAGFAFWSAESWHLRIMFGSGIRSVDP
jgi:hypothetical protein